MYYTHVFIYYIIFTIYYFYNLSITLYKYILEKAVDLINIKDNS